jgi:hypothetical protein
MTDETEEKTTKNSGAGAALFIIAMAIIGGLVGAELWFMSFLSDIIKVTR